MFFHHNVQFQKVKVLIYLKIPPKIAFPDETEGMFLTIFIRARHGIKEIFLQTTVNKGNKRKYVMQHVYVKSYMFNRFSTNSSPVNIRLAQCSQLLPQNRILR